MIAHFGAIMAAKTIYSTAYRRLVTRLRELREAAGISQSALAATLGWPQQRLSAVEAGARRLDIMEFLHLTGALGLSPEMAIQLAAGASTKSRLTQRKG
ncbi:helix-turn-helix transcriptional regulator [Stenotrophomonas sp. Marseille-Q4652]|uniref:helix-turn-helix domain-containing protein n=1 Tax=Stenotrophomonas sp. Marseille-Q4652 TaxID=2866595 RepID=UPI001CE3F110|nr:helix-turn-helix transcriptional regulator [Stenotrophomonas sp. Marseille-Q4652]